MNLKKKTLVKTWKFDLQETRTEEKLITKKNPERIKDKRHVNHQNHESKIMGYGSHVIRLLTLKNVDDSS